MMRVEWSSDLLRGTTTEQLVDSMIPKGEAVDEWARQTSHEQDHFYSSWECGGWDETIFPCLNFSTNVLEMQMIFPSV